MQIQGPILPRKPGSGRTCKITPVMLRNIMKKLNDTPTITAKKLTKVLSSLANVSMRGIQHVCQKTLEMSSRKMAEKPLINERMKQQRLAFAREYNMRTGRLRTGSRGCSLMRAS
jgi:hypothetical protein